MTNSKCEDQLQAFKLDKLTYPTQIRAYLHNEVDKYVMVWETKKVSMTSLLMHTVAHSTKPSFMPKTNNQPHKNVLSLALSCTKVVKNGKILTFKVNFLCQKISESF